MPGHLSHPSANRDTRGSTHPSPAAALAIILVVSLTALPTFAADTQAPSRLTLAHAVKSAIDHSPRVAAASGRSEAARQRIDEAVAAGLPRLWITANATRFEEPMIVTPIHAFSPGLQPDFDESVALASLTVEQSLWDGGRRRSRTLQASSEADLAELGQTSSSQAIALQTSAIYLDILTVRETLDAQNARLRSLAEELDRVHRLREVGRAAEIEILRVEATIAAAESDKVALESRLDASERSLARLTGLDLAATRAVNLTGVEMPEAQASREEIESIAVSGNPDARIARTSILSADAGIDVARSAYFPEVLVAGAINGYGSPDVSFETEWQVGVRLRVPLWDGGATSSRVAAATAMREAAKRNLDETDLIVRNRVDATLAQISGSAATVSSLGKAVARFEEVARIEKLRLDLGAGTQTDYLRAEADLVQARAALSAARYRHVMARIELASVTGEIGADWIENHVRNAS